ncbi:amidase [Aliidiomarina sedimenti]|uniref:Amidase n=1 Tax=Aliidiomarina sedimenti TaxID=1933879 RepID=A0ABY0BV41_9GAMM|nr:amidase family protein [Aliidiomarina sedimenti]RUO28106.1 amidase [Aliidiomarina sedimenti]
MTFLRRCYLQFFALLAATSLIACAATEPPVEEQLAFASVAQIQQLYSSNQLSSEELIRYYQARIAANNDAGMQLRAIIDLNPDALQIARQLDQERANGTLRSPLHGMPVVLKANIATHDRLPTTAGAEVLQDHYTASDAEVVAQLRQQGLIVLGKANLSEWANFRGFSSSSGWSGLGGQARNPYLPTHTPCGSSSGSAVAVAADFSLLAVGTETDGSIMCPASINGVVGVKSTRGSVSGDGIIPIASAQDIAGPMARYVDDARLLLNAMLTPAAREQMEQQQGDTKKVLLVRAYDDHFAGVEAMTERVELQLEQAGIDVVSTDQWQLPEGLGDAELEVLLYEFKRDLNQWLSDYDAPSQAATIDDVIAYNNTHADRVLIHFGQEYFEQASAIDLEASEDSYLQALQSGRQLASEFLDNLLEQHGADAIVIPSYGPAWPIDHENGDGFNFGTSTAAAVSGYPSVTLRAGFENKLPLGISLIGPNFSDYQLLELARVLEASGSGFVAPHMQTATE